MNTTDDAADMSRNDDKFSEEKYYAAYKQIRNRFRQYSPVELISQIALFINSGQTDIEKLQRQPWLGMLLIKWVLLDDNFDQPKRRAPRLDEVQSLMQSMLDLAVKARMPDDFEHFILFMRALSQQQFHYQTAFSASSFFRQMILFGDLDPSHKLKRQFTVGIGIELAEFFEMATALMARFITAPVFFVDPHWFSTLKVKDVEAKSRLFLDTFAATPKQLRERLLKLDGTRRPAREYHELTPMIDTPLINIGGRYWMFHPAIMNRRLEHFVHDYLRTKDPNGFMHSFGKIFEKHIGSIIESTLLPVVTEDEIKKLRKHKGHAIDFVIVDGDSHIFVDAKGVVNSNRVMTTHLSHVVRDSLKDSAVKAIRQAIDVQTWLNGEFGLPETLKPRKRNYLIVVTYKTLYLGNGITFRDAMAKADLDEIYSQSGLHSELSLENIYFMSVEEFDLLCHAVAASKIRFSEAIDQARTADSNPESRRFEFRQHMREWPFFYEMRDALQVPFMNEMDRFIAKYKDV